MRCSVVVLCPSKHVVGKYQWGKLRFPSASMQDHTFVNTAEEKAQLRPGEPAVDPYQLFIHTRYTARLLSLPQLGRGALCQHISISVLGNTLEAS